MNGLDINRNEIRDETIISKEAERPLDLANVVDVDLLDKNDPNFVPDYAKDIFSYIFKVEKEFKISPDFLRNNDDVKRLRSKLVNSMIKIHSLKKLNLYQETLYMCVQIFDSYLQVNI